MSAERLPRSSAAGRATRRQVLAGIGLYAALGLPPEALAAAPVAAPSNPGDADADELERFVRLRSSPGHAPVMWVFDGVLLVKPEGSVARPLVRSSGVSLTRVIPRAPDRYDFRLEEVGYFRDLAGGEVLERWTNPLTGREVRPRNYRTPESLQLRAGGPLAPSMPADFEFRGELTTLAEVAGMVAMTEDLYVRVPPLPALPATAGAAARPARAGRFLASLGTYTASAADLRRPADEWVDCTLAYATMNSFAEWLGMGGTAGVQNLRLAGRKVPHTDLDALPAWLRARIARDHPGFLDVPAQWLREG